MAHDHIIMEAFCTNCFKQTGKSFHTKDLYKEDWAFTIDQAKTIAYLLNKLTISVEARCFHCGKLFQKTISAHTLSYIKKRYAMTTSEVNTWKTTTQTNL